MTTTDMELTAFDGQNVTVAFSREEFQTLVRMCRFVSSAYDTIERELITINSPRHKVDVVLGGVDTVAAKTAIK
ncbi:MAG TPA: hypothetical protein VFT64_09080 [Rickettsiales bacterium]|nr:hypothetical protein [Rickettsiales bacterium]